VTAWQRALGAYGARRYAVLFYTLLASLVVSPLVRPLGFGGDVIEGLIAVNLLAAVLALRRASARWPAAAILLAIALTRFLAAEEAVAAASLVAWGLVALLAAASALAFALRGREVGSEQVYAALSAYVLAGFCFALLYWALDHFSPGSMLAGAGTTPGTASVATMVYFSFVTMASLGYGDVLPASDIARGLAVIEVIGGQLYLAALVARLVGALR